MNEADEPLEESFTSLLAAGDDALAAGSLATSFQDLTFPNKLRPRLERDLAFCQLVRQLLRRADNEEVGSTLPQSVSPPNTDPAVDIPLSQLGRFEIRRELGHGAFGVVFLAYDPRLRREVALKVPRAEALVTPELRERFQHEAQAAAGLDHPNVIAVYEAGEVEHVCYIASAYCPGITLADWLRESQEPVPVREAATLIATLAGAVEHAHQHGVLHRDLKPSNILLGARNQEQGVTGEVTAASLAPGSWLLAPKITDFGLAELAAESGQTQTGAILGTPNYMAPEQARGASKDVGPGADLYALGTILYELLTGRTPFRADTALDTLLLVRAADPLAPSKLRQNLPRDLETICLKCLRKEPEKRYATAAALAADLRRYLAGEPIQARPTPAGERAAKWVRRHPATAALVGVGCVAALTVLVVVLFANARLRLQRDEADEQRQLAVNNLRKAREAVDRMLTRVSEERLRGIPQMEKVQLRLLEDAVEFYQDFARQADFDPVLRQETAQAFWRLGNSYKALGDFSRAEQCLGEALILQQALLAADPDNRTCRQDLVRSRHNLGSLYCDTKRFAEAEDSLREAQKLQEQLLLEAPDEPDSLRSLASIHTGIFLLKNELSQRPEQEQACQQAIAILDGLVQRLPAVTEYQISLLVARSNLATLYDGTDRLALAEQLLRRNVQLCEAGMEREPSEVQFRSKLALTSVNLGDVLVKSGRPSEAEQVWRRCAAVRQKLVEDYPNTPHQAYALAHVLRNLAELLARRDDCNEALRLVRQAVAAAQSAVQLAPNVPVFNAMHHQCVETWAEILLQSHEHAEAAKAVSALPPANAQHRLRAATLLAHCVPLAESDKALSESRRQELVHAYTAQAVALLRDALQNGEVDRAALKDPRFDALRQSEAFRQLLATLTNPKR